MLLLALILLAVLFLLWAARPRCRTSEPPEPRPINHDGGPFNLARGIDPRASRQEIDAHYKVNCLTAAQVAKYQRESEEMAKLRREAPEKAREVERLLDFNVRFKPKLADILREYGWGKTTESELWALVYEVFRSKWPGLSSQHFEPGLLIRQMLERVWSDRVGRRDLYLESYGRFFDGSLIVGLSEEEEREQTLQALRHPDRAGPEPPSGEPAISEVVKYVIDSYGAEQGICDWLHALSRRVEQLGLKAEADQADWVVWTDVQKDPHPCGVRLVCRIRVWRTPVSDEERALRARRKQRREQ